MRLICGRTDQEKAVPSVISIGKFDGLHRGHQKLIGRMREYRRSGLRTVLFSFDMSPQAFLNNRSMDYLLTRGEKVRLAEKSGIDLLVEHPFTDDVRKMAPEAFVDEILIGHLGMKAIVVGPDCGFGYKRSGNTEFLRRYASGRYEVEVVEKMEYEGERISSSRIRECLTRGDVRRAAVMLGYAFSYEGVVEHGLQLGRRLGIPTANMSIEEGKLLPAGGVYATRTLIDGRWYGGMSNIGTKPTVAGCRRAGIETHLFDYAGDLYDKTIRTELLLHTRPEIKFSTLEELQSQLRRDKAEIEEKLAGLTNNGSSGMMWDVINL